MARGIRGSLLMLPFAAQDAVPASLARKAYAETNGIGSRYSTLSAADRQSNGYRYTRQLRCEQQHYMVA